MMMKKKKEKKFSFHWEQHLPSIATNLLSASRTDPDGRAVFKAPSESEKTTLGIYTNEWVSEGEKGGLVKAAIRNSFYAMT